MGFNSGLKGLRHKGRLKGQTNIQHVSRYKRFSNHFVKKQKPYRFTDNPFVIEPFINLVFAAGVSRRSAILRSNK